MPLLLVAVTLSLDEPHVRHSILRLLADVEFGHHVVFSLPDVVRRQPANGDKNTHFSRYWVSPFGAATRWRTQVAAVTMIRTLILTSSQPSLGRMRTPELLAPAGNWDCAKAAIENGADAVYFGLDRGFNARARADNFAADDLAELMAYLHLRNVRGYATFNTLVFSDELSEAERSIRDLAVSGVDALLVQDVGAAQLARKICPDLPLHASTQMTMTSAETIALAEDLGMERVVLARELSIQEIQAIRKQTGMDLEVFVHGALCVAYSGQCLTSESLGGRSANRGQCAQACRLTYDLISDGQDVDLGEQRYLLSPQDLAAYELTPQLVQAGVCSFKIEGRLKSPEYVANITRHYRQAIDDACAELTVRMSAQQQYDMEMSFSRGFSPGWLQGCDHKMLVPGLSSAKKGVLAGEVLDVRGHHVAVELDCSLRAGDGIVFEGDRAQQAEQGGRVYGVWEHGTRVNRANANDRVSLTFGPGDLDLAQIVTGMKFWKTDDPRLNQDLRKTYDVADPTRRVPLDLSVFCQVGKPIRLQGKADNGATCQVTSAVPLEKARQHPIGESQLREQLGRLGATVYELRDVEFTIQGQPMVPFSVLGKLRRDMVRQLESADLRPRRNVVPAPIASCHESSDSKLCAADAEESATQLYLLCRTMEQLKAAAENGISNLYAEFQDIREYGEAVDAAHASGAVIYLATPRIQKPGELGIFRSLAKHGADGILVRNYAGLQFFQQASTPTIADFSLNVANPRTAEFFLERGVSRVTASYDLNREQLVDLVRATPANWLECVVHQHMPMFHMEHCVFCAVLSPGTNKTNCGRPCDVHQVELRDRIGMEHPLTADVGCRNTLYNAVPQSSAEVVNQLEQAGVRHFRVELLRESPQAALRTYGLYDDLLAGRLPPSEVWKTLKATNRVGVTRGTLEERNPLAII